MRPTLFFPMLNLLSQSHILQEIKQNKLERKQENSTYAI